MSTETRAYECIGCGDYFLSLKRARHCTTACRKTNPMRGTTANEIEKRIYEPPPRHVLTTLRRKPKTNTIPSWLDIRKRILDLDDYVCRICFKDTAQVKLHVHHIEWDRAFNEDKDLVTLCSVCHKGVHDEGYRPSSEIDPTRPLPWTICR